MTRVVPMCARERCTEPIENEAHAFCRLHLIADEDETRYCRNDWCDNELMPDDDENEPCANCKAEQAKTAAYYERQYRASKQELSKDEVLDAYSDPTDYQKRLRMERDYK